MPTIQVKDAAGSTQTVNTINDNGQAVAADSQSVVLASDQAAIPVAVNFPDTQPVSIAAPVALDSATLAALEVITVTGPAAATLATAAAQATELAAVNLVGTRAYAVGITRLTLTTSDQASTAITGTEVLLHAPLTNTGRAYIRANTAATLNDIPLEPGEKFHMRIASGNTIHALLDTGAGFLNIVPVA